MLCQILMSDPVFGRWTLFVILIKLKTKNNNKKAIPVFFFRLPSNAFPDIGSDWKKKPKKKITRSLGISGPDTPRRRQKSTFTYLDEQNAQHTVKMFSFLFLFFPMLLLCSILRLKGLFQVKNVWTTSLRFFFLKMPKIWIGRTTVNGEKNGDGLMYNLNV